MPNLLESLYTTNSQKIGEAKLTPEMMAQIKIQE
jgi:hypothetical protein